MRTLYRDEPDPEEQKKLKIANLLKELQSKSSTEGWRGEELPPALVEAITTITTNQESKGKDENLSELFKELLKVTDEEGTFLQKSESELESRKWPFRFMGPKSSFSKESSMANPEGDLLFEQSEQSRKWPFRFMGPKTNYRVTKAGQEQGYGLD